MKTETIEKIEKAIAMLEEARNEIPGNERFYNEYYSNITLFDHILQLKNYVQHAKDTNDGLTSIDVLRRDIEKSKIKGGTSTKMITLDEIKKNMLGITGYDLKELKAGIVDAFDNYHIDDENEVIVKVYGLTGEAYINHQKSPIIIFDMIGTEDDEHKNCYYDFKIVEVR